MRYQELLNETLLFRGDSSKIEQFDQSKSAQMFLLYTHGIYLTDAPDVAEDYTLKDSEQTVFRDDKAKTPQALLRGYIRKVADEQLGINAAASKLQSQWRDKAWQSQADHPRGTAFDSKPLEAEMRQELLDLRNKLFLKAKKLVVAQRDNLRMMKLTTGELVLVKTNREGYVTKFEVPESYLAKTLHVDQPLPTKVLEMIKQLWAATSGGDPERIYDMRDANGKFSTFDNWVTAFRTTGITFASGEQGDGRNDGGKGVLPDLEAVWHGTHMGEQWFLDRANVSAFIAGMQKLGYVGLEYSGGLRAGGYTRGGGGRLHRAFVFWNDDDINRFRVDAKKVVDPEVDAKQLCYVRS